MFEKRKGAHAHTSLVTRGPGQWARARTLRHGHRPVRAQNGATDKSNASRAQSAGNLATSWARVSAPAYREPMLPTHCPCKLPLQCDRDLLHCEGSPLTSCPRRLLVLCRGKLVTNVSSSVAEQRHDLWPEAAKGLEEQRRDRQTLRLRLCVVTTHRRHVARACERVPLSTLGHTALCQPHHLLECYQRPPAAPEGKAS